MLLCQLRAFLLCPLGVICSLRGDRIAPKRHNRNTLDRDTGMKSREPSIP